MPLAYIPLAQANEAFLRLVHGWFSPSFLVRGERTSGELVPAIREAIESTDPLLPLARVRPLEQVQADAIAQPRLFMTLLVMLALTAVLLAALGLASLVASTVTERTREIGIRMALGATTARAVRTLAVPAVLLAVVGIAIGAAVARSAVSLLRGFIWGVAPTDPGTYLAVGVLFVVIAAVASLVPTLRILRMDPAVTLRQE
jgi:predicted lysophospholipase L1 biosynthesis ABC-type transport system permease subunit